MADRIIRMRENGRATTRGVTTRGDGSFHLAIRDSHDVLPVIVDWAAWLGDDTIASVENDATAADVTAESNTATQASFSLSGEIGYFEHRITTTAGATKTIVVSVNGTDHRFSDYPQWRA